MRKFNRINRIRKRLTSTFRKNLPEIQAASIDRPENVKCVLLIRPNHRLGNQLLVTPLLQEATTIFPNAKIDLFLKGNAGINIFKNFKSVDRILRLPKKHFKEFTHYFTSFWCLKNREYDVVINVSLGSSSGKLATHHARSKIKLSNEDLTNTIKEKYPDAKHMAKSGVYRLRAALKGDIEGLDKKPIPNLSLALTDDELKKANDIIKQKVGDTQKIISIFTHATGEKKLSKEWWHAFYYRLKKEFPDYEILEILPIENISSIDFKAPSYYGKDIRMISAVVQQTDLFVGTDSGIMHLADSTKTPCIGLFSISRPQVYAPYSKGSFAFDVQNATIDDLLHQAKGSLSY